MEKTGSTVDKIYLWGNGIEALIVPDGSDIQFYGYLKNAHGDVLTVSQGFYNYAEYDYDAYGNVVACTESQITNPIRYAGYYYDTDTQNYYLKNRYYSPYQGRFLTEDTYWTVSNMLYGKFTDMVEKRVYYPAIVQSANRFAYCLNNPVMFADTLGYMSCGVHGNGGNDRFRITSFEPIMKYVTGFKEKIADVFQKAKNEGIQLASKHFLELLKNTNGLYSSDNILLAAGMRQKSIEGHYEHNDSLQITGFINNQYSGKAAQVQMGEAVFGSNACGWIAAYNAFKVLKNKVSPADIVSFFESNDYLICDGAFGVNPLAFDHIFEVYGFSSSTVYFDTTDLDTQAQTSETSILAYAYISGDAVGAHFINLTWDEEKQEYIVYNDDGFSSISDFLESNGYIFISLTLINEREVYDV